MAKINKTLHLLSMKLGLSEEDKVLSKAAEFERLLQMKSTVSNITDTTKAVICLDLAANYFRVDIDQKTAVKCSGVKGPSYQNSRKIIENVLELNNERLTITALCLTLQCSVQDLADQILQEYRKYSKMDIDMSLPQYVCMAVYQACRINKIKVPKSKLIEKSQLKPAQWSKLDAEWTKFTDVKFAAVKKKRGRVAKNAMTEEPYEMEVDSEVINKKEENSEPHIEPYEDWKRRILESAYKELQNLKPKETKENIKLVKEIKQNDNTIKQLENANKQLENTKPTKQMGCFSPRRSPRKTPQKFEPYKSPAKDIKGVRLLFPM